ncbi:laccase domain-containing protein [Klebsiella variicola subsp. variicola]|nr:laccase domain-containing protein [Klebsiella variicola subsp. variicola]
MLCPRHLAYGKTSFPDAYRPHGLHLPFAQCNPCIRHAFLDVHETAAFPYAELAPVKLVHGNEVHHYQQPLPTRPHADAVFTAVAGQKVGGGDRRLSAAADRLARRSLRLQCVHAGWRGWASGIVSIIVWPVFASRGWHWPIWSSPWGRIFTPCCYEVSAGFYQQLLDQPGGDRWPCHRQRLFHSRSGPVSDPPRSRRTRQR